MKFKSAVIIDIIIDIILFLLLFFGQQVGCLAGNVVKVWCRHPCNDCEKMLRTTFITGIVTRTIPTTTVLIGC